MHSCFIISCISKPGLATLALTPPECKGRSYICLFSGNLSNDFIVTMTPGFHDGEKVMLLCLETTRLGFTCYGASFGAL